MTIRNACCAVAADSQQEVTLVHFLLAGEFSQIVDVVTELDWQALVQRDDVAVLVLAFRDLTLASNFQQRYVYQRLMMGGRPALVVMLCSSEDVGAAYDLCRSHDILDYVMFWPVTHDPKRLPLAAHRACDAYEDDAIRGPRPAAAIPVNLDLNAEVAIAGTESGPVELPVAPEVHVLVVEDDRFQLATVVSMLSTAGLRVTGATGAQAALTQIESSVPDLMLLDVDMPDMDGMQLLRLLKSTPQHTRIPVIMLTIMREREMVLEALRIGAADFIAKPFDRDTLLHKIRRIAGDW